jgi:hypothetical protein
MSIIIFWSEVEPKREGERERKEIEREREREANVISGSRRK